jgi:hypothetical protein
MTKRDDRPGAAGLFNWRAVATGAAVALAVAVPTIVISSLAGIDAESNMVFVAFLVYLVGEGLGGWRAATLEPDAPLSNGAAAAVAAYALIGVVASIIRASRGDSLDPESLILNAFLAASAGIFGGLVATWRHKPDAATPGDRRTGRRKT